jgi:hypothetical protein
LAYPSTVKEEEKHRSETSADFQRSTRRYIREMFKRQFNVRSQELVYFQTHWTELKSPSLSCTQIVYVEREDVPTVNEEAERKREKFSSESNVDR